MGGVVGRLFREFADTICVAILISGFVSLSLTPMLCSCFLRPPSEEKHGRFYMIIGNFFNHMLKIYERSLRLALNYRLTIMAASGIILSFILYWEYSTRALILSGLPSAGLGALLTLLIFHMDLDVYAFVGLVMVALEAQRKEGKNPLEAIYQGCLIRFRLIMMTTMAALIGALPIALGFGAGAEARRPLGLVMMGVWSFHNL